MTELIVELKGASIIALGSYEVQVNVLFILPKIVLAESISETVKLSFNLSEKYEPLSNRKFKN